MIKKILFTVYFLSVSLIQAYQLLESEMLAILEHPQETFVTFGPHTGTVAEVIKNISCTFSDSCAVELNTLCAEIQAGKTTAPRVVVERAIQQALACLERESNPEWSGILHDYLNQLSTEHVTLNIIIDGDVSSTKSARVDCAQTPQPVLNVDPRYIDSRDLYLRNLEVAGQLTLNDLLITGSPACILFQDLSNTIIGRICVNEDAMILAPVVPRAIQATCDGDLRGVSAIDFQMSRQTPDQVASGNYSVISGGQNNTASGAGYSVVAGGYGNISNGYGSAVLGGFGNTISMDGYTSTIAGGDQNNVVGELSFLGGGFANTITSDGTYAALIGGIENTTSGGSAIVCAGEGNTASGGASFVGSGEENTASGIRSFVGSGFRNVASGADAVVAGGGTDGNDLIVGNRAQGVSSFIGAGLGNTAQNIYDAVVSGSGNTASGSYSIVGGGFENSASGAGSVVVGGGVAILQGPTYGPNTASGTASFIGGGLGNVAAAPGSVIVGGGFYGGLVAGNSIQQTSSDSFIGGGNFNNIDSQSENAFIGGGLGNTAQSGSFFSGIVSGSGNTAGGAFTFVGSGFENTASGYASGVVTGTGNFAGGDFSFVGGGYDNIASGFASVVTGGFDNAINGDFSFVGGGDEHIITSQESAIAGGFSNFIASDNSAIGGGFKNYIYESFPGRSVITGGSNNYINSAYASIGGGQNNFINGQSATIPGGLFNAANGDNSFAAGNTALATGTGSFVWADSVGYPLASPVFESAGNNTFNVRANGGAIFAVDATTETPDLSLTISADRSIQPSIELATTGAAPYISLEMVLRGTGALYARSDVTVDPITGLPLVPGNQRGAYAVDLQLTRTLDNQVASGDYSALLGGYNNIAAGTSSIALGNNAQALHDNTFVWADGQATPFASTNPDSFNIRAKNGFVFGGDDAETITLLVPSGLSPSYTLTLPVNTGLQFQVLATDGNNPAQLFWITTATCRPELLCTATSCDIPNTLVLRDANGSFSATTITLTGNTMVSFGTQPCDATPFIFAPLNNNTLMGVYAGNNGTLTGTGNTAFGNYALSNLATGTYNIALGNYAGSAYTAGESDNILLGNSGVADENSTIRIGADQTACYVAGVYNAAPAADALVIINSSGQFGSSSALLSTLTTATPADIPLTLVLRDSTGSFAATNVTVTCLIINDQAGGTQAATICANPNAFVITPYDTRAVIAQSNNPLAADGITPNVAGNARGQFAVDLQLTRTLMSQIASGTASALLGGYGNTASGFASAVVGGKGHTASGDFSFIGGGDPNIASGKYSAILGGLNNVAQGTSSVAMGNNAYAQHDNSFVWADGQTGTFTSAGSDSFNIRATNGLVITGSMNNNLILLAQNSMNSTFTLQFPTTAGSDGYVLTTNGANPATLSWQPNGGTSPTLLLSATSVDTPLTLVLRDSTGSFEATNITVTCLIINDQETGAQAATLCADADALTMVLNDNRALQVNANGGAQFNIQNYGLPSDYALAITADNSIQPSVQLATTGTANYVSLEFLVRGTGAFYARSDSQPAFPANTAIDSIFVSGSPTGIAITPDGDYAYVTAGFGTGVSIINLTTNTFTSTVNDPSNTLKQPHGIAITTNGDYAYVTNGLGGLYGAGSVSVIDLMNNTVTTTVNDLSTPFNSPSDIAISGDYAYVTNQNGGTSGNGAVSVIDLMSNSVTTTVYDPHGSFNYPYEIALYGNFAYVTNVNGGLYGTGGVSVIDLTSNTVTTTVNDFNSPGSFNVPTGIAITPDGNFAYVTNFGGNSVSVIDLQSNVVTTTVYDPLNTFSYPYAIAITPNGDYAYVTNFEGFTVSVIDLATNTVTGVVNDPLNSFLGTLGIAIAPNGDSAYVTNLSEEVSVINLLATPAVLGNQRGVNAIDLQLLRIAETQVASGAFSTLLGGFGNTASGNASAVVGGSNNTASGIRSAVAGGFGNIASGIGSAIGGGLNNTVSGYASTIAGGYGNTASGQASIVCGGSNNTASGFSSFAAGNNANATQDNSFVWSDGSASTTTSVPYSFVARASRGYTFYTTGSNVTTIAPGGSGWTPASDKTKKRNFEEIDHVDILEKVAAMPIEKWSYQSQDESVRHMGPYAQDFYKAFSLGEQPLGINTVDADGVLFAAIKGMYKLHQDDCVRIALLETELKELKDKINLLSSKE